MHFQGGLGPDEEKQQKVARLMEAWSRCLEVVPERLKHNFDTEVAKIIDAAAQQIRQRAIAEFTGSAGGSFNPMAGQPEPDGLGNFPTQPQYRGGAPGSGYDSDESEADDYETLEWLLDELPEEEVEELLIKLALAADKRRPPRVLVVRGSEHDNLAGDEEVLAIQAAVEGAGCGFKIILAASDQLGEELLKEGAPKYDIVHYIGHGDKIGLHASGGAGKHLDGHGLSQLLATHAAEHGDTKPALRLVFLNACSSYEQGLTLSEEVGYSGRKAVGSVICVHGMIADKAVAVPFATMFYATLAASLEENGENPAVWADEIQDAYWTALDGLGEPSVPSALPILLNRGGMAAGRPGPTSMAAAQLIQAQLMGTASRHVDGQLLIGVPTTDLPPAAMDRGYQQRLVSAAVDKNLIVALRTGAGKTRIALRLAETALRRFPEKKVVFSCPTIPLAEQQMAGFAHIFRVGALFGGKGKGLAVAQVVFATPAALLGQVRVPTTWTIIQRDGPNHLGLRCNLLPEHHMALITSDCVPSQTGWLEVFKVSLIIIDEVHHTRGGSPLSEMAEVYRGLPKKPRVLGLTALPVNAAEAAKGGVARLCGDWLAHIETVSPGAEDAEIASQVPVPALQLVKIDGSDAELLEMRLAELKEDERLAQQDGDGARHREIVLERELVQVDCKFDEVLNQLRLAGEVMAAGGPVPRVIVFVTMCDTVLHLLGRLQAAAAQDPTRLSWMKAEFLIGHNNGKSAAARMTMPTQQAVLRRFKAGVSNVLIATSVAEEGLDVPACALVLRLDVRPGGPRMNEIGFIQSRGRARYPGAQYIVVTAGSIEAEYVQELQAGEQAVLMSVLDTRQRQALAPRPCVTIWDEGGAGKDPPTQVVQAEAVVEPVGKIFRPIFLGMDPGPMPATATAKTSPPPQKNYLHPVVDLKELCDHEGWGQPDYKFERVGECAQSMHYLAGEWPHSPRIMIKSGEQNFAASVEVPGSPLAIARVQGGEALGKKKSQAAAAMVWLHAADRVLAGFDAGPAAAMPAPKPAKGPLSRDAAARPARAPAPGRVPLKLAAKSTKPPAPSSGEAAVLLQRHYERCHVRAHSPALQLATRLGGGGVPVPGVSKYSDMLARGPDGSKGFTGGDGRLPPRPLFTCAAAALTADGDRYLLHPPIHLAGVSIGDADGASAK